MPSCVPSPSLPSVWIQVCGPDLELNVLSRKNKKAYLIFSTGHLEYSLVAYSVKTFDYLPKPITLERLEITLNRLLDDLNTNSYKKFIKFTTV